LCYMQAFKIQSQHLVSSLLEIAFCMLVHAKHHDTCKHDQPEKKELSWPQRTRCPIITECHQENVTTIRMALHPLSKRFAVSFLYTNRISRTTQRCMMAMKQIKAPAILQGLLASSGTIFGAMGITIFMIISEIVAAHNAKPVSFRNEPMFR